MHSGFANNIEESFKKITSVGYIPSRHELRLQPYHQLTPQVRENSGAGYIKFYT